MKKIVSVLTVLLLLCVMTYGQTRTIRGVVRDDRGTPAPFATILEAGTKNTAVADTNGVFSINVQSGARLTITATGHETQTVSAANAANGIALKTNTGQLNEVVVVAYGSQRRTNITGSVATVSPAAIENKPFTSVDKSLQGYVAGLQSSSASGAPGSNADIRIRGVGSITAAGASPLWVIDGVIATTGDLSSQTTTSNALSSLNPDDIESISVLKDAASASVYGSRAANGVILVTTKKGRAGRTRVNFSSEAGRSDIAFDPKNKPVNTAQYQTLLRESLINAGYATNTAEADALIIDPTNGLGIDSNYTKTSTDWRDQVTRTATQQQYNLSLSGGNEKTTFYASGGFFKQTGIVIATDFKRYNGSLSVTHRPTDKLLFTAGLNIGYTNQRTPLNGGYFSNPASAPFFLLPWYSPYNADGSLKYNDAGGQFPLSGGQFNPLVISAYDKSSAQQTIFRGYVSGEYNILKGLKFTSRYSGEYFNIQEDEYRNPFYGDGQAQGGDAYSSFRKIFNWTWSNYFDYRKGLNKAEDIYFDVKLGYEAQEIKNYVIQAGGQAFPQTLDLQYLASAATPTVAYTLPITASTNSIFSTADFNFKNRYVISGSFRRDGSSVFGANHRYGNFYSVGGTWNVNEESFIKNISLVSALKLRSSYGENGNQNGIGYYTSLPTFGFGNNYTGQPGSALSNVGNPDLTWEKNAIFNVGIDFGILKNRLYGTVEYYNRHTSDLLLAVPLSPTSGVATQNRNVGAMTNKGIEITLGGKPVVTKDFSWDLSANFSHNDNKVTELYLGNPVANGLFNYTVGHSIYEYYTRQWAGVDPANGNPLWYTNGNHTATTSSTTAATLALSGKTALPKFFGSVITSFTYKGFTLDGQLYYNYGNYIYVNYSRYINSDGAGYGADGQLTEQLSSWKKAGDVTDVPKLVFGGNMNSSVTSTRYLYKGDYIRLRNVQLSYNIPATALRKTRLSTASIYVRGTNLFTFNTDDRLPVDPETGATSTGNFDVYIPRTITAGVRIGL